MLKNRKYWEKFPVLTLKMMHLIDERIPLITRKIKFKLLRLLDLRELNIYLDYVANRQTISGKEMRYLLEHLNKQSEKNGFEIELIYKVLGLLYPVDEKYILMKFPKWIFTYPNSGNKLYWYGYKLSSLEYSIREYKTYIFSDILVSELIRPNLNLLVVGHLFIKNIMKSNEEWLAYCIRWINEGIDIAYILPNLSSLVEEFRRANQKQVISKLLIIRSITRSFADNFNIKWSSIEKSINYGKGDFSINYTLGMKILKTIDEIKSYIKVTNNLNLELREKRLGQFQYISNGYGKRGLNKNLKKHPVLFMNQLLGSDNSESIELLRYWDDNFQTLFSAGIKISSSKLRDPNTELDTLTEVELLAKLLEIFAVEYEPRHGPLLPKKLDAKITYNNLKSLIEIKTLYDEDNLEYGNTTVGLDRGRFKNKIKTVFNNQLHSGKYDPKMPIVLFFNVSHSTISDIMIEDTFHGEMKMRIDFDKSIGQAIPDSERIIRLNNSVFDIPNIDIISAIIVYRTNSKGKFTGKMFLPKKSRNPLSYHLIDLIHFCLFENDSDVDPYNYL